MLTTQEREDILHRYLFLIILAIAIICVAGWSHAATQARITGYGELQFGTSVEVARKAYPGKRWGCQDKEGGAYACIVDEPGIPDMDYLGLVYIDGKLVKIVMTTRTTYVNSELLATWDKYKHVITEKYGPPSMINELMLPPYDNTRAEFIRYGISATSVGKCHYAALWIDGDSPTSPAISLWMKAGWVEIGYESSAFRQWGHQQNVEHFSKF